MRVCVSYRRNLFHDSHLMMTWSDLLLMLSCRHPRLAHESFMKSKAAWQQDRRLYQYLGWRWLRKVSRG